MAPTLPKRNSGDLLDSSSSPSWCSKRHHHEALQQLSGPSLTVKKDRFIVGHATIEAIPFDSARRA